MTPYASAAKKTPGEKREYTRGYNRGVNRMSQRVQQIIEVAKRYRARLSDHDRTRDCKSCWRWTRGGEHCLWGYCNAQFEWSLDQKMWAETVPHGGVAKIVTQEKFGCVSWLPKDHSLSEPSS